MRRHVGLTSLHNQTSQSSAYNTLGTSISASQLNQLESSLATFQRALRHFASVHRSKILSDPAFRSHFSQMCAQVGVDPLGGAQKGVWGFLGVSDWTYGLAVQVVDVCLATREANGGLIEMGELVRGVAKLRTGQESGAAVSERDVVQAIKALKPLHCGYDLVSLGSITMVRCVPQALDSDALLVLQCASALHKPWVTRDTFASYARDQGWKGTRAEQALEKAIVEEGLVWEDCAPGEETRYWIPSLVIFDNLR